MSGARRLLSFVSFGAVLLPVIQGTTSVALARRIAHLARLRQNWIAVRVDLGSLAAQTLFLAQLLCTRSMRSRGGVVLTGLRCFDRTRVSGGMRALGLALLKGPEEISKELLESNSDKVVGITIREHVVNKVW